MPDGVDGPDVWLLASSSDGAAAAAAAGLPLCFAHFISPGFGPQIVGRYRKAFSASPAASAEAIVAVAAICAETDGEAQELATSGEVWRLTGEDGRGPVPSVGEARARGVTELEAALITQRRRGVVVGGPDRVARELTGLAEAFDVRELVVLTVCHDPAARLRSYELLADAFALASP